MVQRRVCKTRYQGFDSPLGLVKILEIVLAGILFLGALRAIRILVLSGAAGALAFI